MKPSLLPRRIVERITDRAAFEDELEFLSEQPLADLYEATVRHLKNLDRLVENSGADFDLRAVLVPEIWERLRSESRTPLRRITTSLAEYRDDDTRSVFRRLLSSEAQARLAREADAMHAKIKETSKIDRVALVERVRFAIAGSAASARFPPSAYVYEPAFAYRLAPELARRCP